MAKIFEPGIFYAPAGADLSAKYGFFVKLNSSGAVVLCDTAGELALGVLDNAPTSGQSARVLFGRVAKVVASGSIAINTDIKTDTAGKAASASKGVVNTSDAGAASDPVLGSNVMGRLLEAAGADGDIVTALIFPMGTIPTTAS